MEILEYSEQHTSFALGGLLQKQKDIHIINKQTKGLLEIGRHKRFYSSVGIQQNSKGCQVGGLEKTVKII